MLGLAWITPILKALAGDNPRAQAGEIWRLLGVPVLAILVFLFAWGTLAPKVQTSLGAVPGPVQVWEQVGTLHADYLREKDREAAFYERQDARTAAAIAEGNTDAVRNRFIPVTTYYAQIWTSIQTVFFGFLIASQCYPLGIAAGLSVTANAALNPRSRSLSPFRHSLGCRLLR